MTISLLSGRKENAPKTRSVTLRFSSVHISEESMQNRKQGVFWFIAVQQIDRQVPEGKEKETASKIKTRSLNRREAEGNSLHDPEVQAMEDVKPETVNIPATEHQRRRGEECLSCEDIELSAYQEKHPTRIVRRRKHDTLRKSPVVGVQI